MKFKKIKFKISCIIYAMLVMAMEIFFVRANADAILITSKTPNNLGHTSVISQNEEGKWIYFYWGNTLAYQKEVPLESMKNINTLNEWFLKQKNENTKPKSSNNFYTHGIYIKGDFTNTTKYYSHAVTNYNLWQYYLGLNFCSVVSRKAMNKGVLPDGQPFAKHLKYKFADYLPFYDVFPDNYRQLVERSFKKTEYEGDPEWGKVTNEKILNLMGQDENKKENKL